uniref:DNA-directed RNA polymerase n=1 Tax=Xylochloris irregularis TaxID=480381 RepID=A0A097KMD7_9CHLO|nr:beta'' subunit of RNA polymerase [Xylochloris irregularis]AIT94342.1 beta'' subunit of RNA polymerase [Xylochloris irregularis]
MKKQSFFFNYGFDKGKLRILISWFFQMHGEPATFHLVERLKGLGFEHATQSGSSIGVDDLSTPTTKIPMLSNVELSIQDIDTKYQRGLIHSMERFQQTIEIWQEMNEKIKEEVVDHFSSTDLLNPVYMMAFSGARGNISQVRQLVGMRGLMADPEGELIDFPIRSNFREGLTLTEYVISCYGARKGLVDTALRTATSGYLTRRLVDVCQHVVVSSWECGTSRGIFLSKLEDEKKKKVISSLEDRLIGRTLFEDVVIPPAELPTLKKLRVEDSLKPVVLPQVGFDNLKRLVGEDPAAPTHPQPSPFSDLQNPPFSEETTLSPFVSKDLPFLKKFPLSIRHIKTKGAVKLFKNTQLSRSQAAFLAEIREQVLVRSPLTCEQEHSICQLCYGWALSSSNLVSLGEAVGVIAGQSIGEPGTQLTMRTFHTGGVFSGELAELIRATGRGVVAFQTPLPGSLVRTQKGKIAFLTKAPGVLHFDPLSHLTGDGSDQPEKTSFALPPTTLLFVKQGERVEKGQPLAQLAGMGMPLDSQEEIYVKSEMEGEICNLKADRPATTDKEEERISFLILFGKLVGNSSYSLPLHGDLIDKFTAVSSSLKDNPFNVDGRLELYQQLRKIRFQTGSLSNPSLVPQLDSFQNTNQPSLGRGSKTSLKKGRGVFYPPKNETFLYKGGSKNRLFSKTGDLHSQVFDFEVVLQKPILEIFYKDIQYNKTGYLLTAGGQPRSGKLLVRHSLSQGFCFFCVIFLKLSFLQFFDKADHTKTGGTVYQHALYFNTPVQSEALRGESLVFKEKMRGSLFFVEEERQHLQLPSREKQTLHFLTELTQNYLSKKGSQTFLFSTVKKQSRQGQTYCIEQVRILQTLKVLKKLQKKSEVQQFDLTRSGDLRHKNQNKKKKKGSKGKLPTSSHLSFPNSFIETAVPSLKESVRKVDLFVDLTRLRLKTIAFHHHSCLFQIKDYSIFKLQKFEKEAKIIQIKDLNESEQSSDKKIEDLKYKRTINKPNLFQQGCSLKKRVQMSWGLEKTNNQYSRGLPTFPSSYASMKVGRLFFKKCSKQVLDYSIFELQRLFQIRDLKKSFAYSNQRFEKKAKLIQIKDLNGFEQSSDKKIKESSNLQFEKKQSFEIISDFKHKKTSNKNRSRSGYLSETIVPNPLFLITQPVSLSTVSVVSPFINLPSLIRFQTNLFYLNPARHMSLAPSPRFQAVCKRRAREKKANVFQSFAYSNQRFEQQSPWLCDGTRLGWMQKRSLDFRESSNRFTFNPSSKVTSLWGEILKGYQTYLPLYQTFTRKEQQSARSKINLVSHLVTRFQDQQNLPVRGQEKAKRGVTRCWLASAISKPVFSNLRIQIKKGSKQSFEKLNRSPFRDKRTIDQRKAILPVQSFFCSSPSQSKAGYQIKDLNKLCFEKNRRFENISDLKYRRVESKGLKKNQTAFTRGGVFKTGWAFFSRADSRNHHKKLVHTGERGVEDLLFDHFPTVLESFIFRVTFIHHLEGGDVIIQNKAGSNQRLFQSFAFLIDLRDTLYRQAQAVKTFLNLLKPTRLRLEIARSSFVKNLQLLSQTEKKEIPLLVATSLFTRKEMTRGVMPLQFQFVTNNHSRWKRIENSNLSVLNSDDKKLSRVSLIKGFGFSWCLLDTKKVELVDVRRPALWFTSLSEEGVLIRKLCEKPSGQLKRTRCSIIKNVLFCKSKQHLSAGEMELAQNKERLPFSNAMIEERFSQNVVWLDGHYSVNWRMKTRLNCSPSLSSPHRSSRHKRKGNIFSFLLILQFPKRFPFEKTLFQCQFVTRAVVGTKEEGEKLFHFVSLPLFKTSTFQEVNFFSTREPKLSMVDYFSARLEPQIVTTGLSGYSGEVVVVTAHDDRASQNLFVVTESEQTAFLTTQKRGAIKIGDFVVYGQSFADKSQAGESGQLIEIDSHKMVLRRGQWFANKLRNSLFIGDGKVLEQGSPIMNFSYQRSKTEDIVQGIPRIEQFFEARSPKEKQLLSLEFERVREEHFQHYTPTEALLKSYERLQSMVVTTIQRMYLSQGVGIADKHVEIIVKQMTSAVLFYNENTDAGHLSPLLSSFSQMMTEAKNLGPSIERTRARQKFFSRATTHFRIIGTVEKIDKKKENALNQQTDTIDVTPIGEAEKPIMLTGVAFSLPLFDSYVRIKVTKTGRPLFSPTMLREGVASSFYHSDRFSASFPIPAIVQSIERWKPLNANLPALRSPKLFTVSFSTRLRRYFWKKALIREELLISPQTPSSKIRVTRQTKLNKQEGVGNITKKEKPDRRQEGVGNTVSSFRQAPRWEYIPALVGITQAALTSRSFFSAASFQQTTLVLTRSASFGRSDFLRGIKERVISGELLRAGTGHPDASLLVGRVSRQTRFVKRERRIERDKKVVTAAVNTSLLHPGPFPLPFPLKEAEAKLVKKWIPVFRQLAMRQKSKQQRGVSDFLKLRFGLRSLIVQSKVGSNLQID